MTLLSPPPEQHVHLRGRRQRTMGNSFSKILRRMKRGLRESSFSPQCGPNSNSGPRASRPSLSMAKMSQPPTSPACCLRAIPGQPAVVGALEKCLLLVCFRGKCTCVTILTICMQACIWTVIIPPLPYPAPRCLRANAIIPVLDREELSLLFVSGPRLSGRKLAESLCFLVCSLGAAAG